MTTIRKRYEIEQRFRGMTNPEDMGTSGLIAWVIAGGTWAKSWNRYRKARAIITARGLDFSRFRDQVIKEARSYNIAYGETFAGYR